MKKNRFLGRKVAVLGFGREGVEAVKLLNRLGAQVTVLDAGTEKSFGTAVLATFRKQGVAFRLGRAYLDNLMDFSIIVRSPGISRQLPELKKAERKGVEISSPTKLFFDLSPTKNIIGVTGTKGKSTTASLIYHLLKGNVTGARLAGNIGIAPLILLSKLKPTDTVVLELSSFQLEDLEVSPQIAVILNVVPEHLDRHRTLARYLASKLNLINFQKKSDSLVASKDFAATKVAIKSARGKVLPVSTEQVLRRGVYVRDEEIIYRDAKTGRRQVVAKVSDIHLPGRHVLQNVLPAIAAAILAGVAPTKIAKRLVSFRSLPNRLEVVRVMGETIFVNDSFATTPEAAAAGVAAMSDRPIALIVGGVLDRGAELKRLAKAINENPVVWVSLIGKSARSMQAAMQAARVFTPRKVFRDFESAVTTAYNKVNEEGVVLLSPGAKSFDMFKNATDRAEQFKKIVRSIKN